MSNEWLTTGQLIDKLRIGQIAECFLEENPRRIKRLESGIYWCNEKGTIIDAGEIVYLGSGLMKWKWRILPNYVSLEKAKEAILNGKGATFHPKGAEPIRITSYHMVYALYQHKNVSFGELFGGNWEIEDDTNA